MTNDGNMATFTFDRTDGTDSQVFLSIDEYERLAINVR